jgi:hypothetical protein
MHLAFPDPARDELCVLGAEVDDQDRVVVRHRMHDAAFPGPSHAPPLAVGPAGLARPRASL